MPKFVKSMRKFQHTGCPSIQWPYQVQMFEQSSMRRGRLVPGVERCNLIYRLRSKYGVGIIADLTALLDRQRWNLADVARKYDFSREHARQIFIQIFGLPYGPIRERKTRLRRISEGRIPELF